MFRLQLFKLTHPTTNMADSTPYKRIKEAFMPANKKNVILLIVEDESSIPSVPYVLFSF